MKSNQPRKRVRRSATLYTDPFSLHGEIKYDSYSMPKKRRTERSATVQRPSTNCPPKKYENKNVPQETVAAGCSQNYEVLCGEATVKQKTTDTFLKYRSAVLSTSSFIVLDSMWKFFCILDFDYETNFLNKSLPLIVYRNGLNFGCQCDDARRTYIDTINPLKPEDVDTLHPPCFHVRFIKEIFMDYFCANQLRIPDEYQDDEHGYAKVGNIDENELDIVELPFVNDSYAVAVGVSYGILKVTTGKIKCLTCNQTSKSHCCHSKYLDVISRYQADKTSEIVEKIYFRVSGLSKSANEIYCCSFKKIPFHLNPVQSQRISCSAENCFLEEDGILQALPMTIEKCPDCGTRLPGEHEPIKQDSYLVSKYKFVKVQSYIKKCPNVVCQKQICYDGLEDCVLNMGKFLVHYEVLRDYMFQLLCSGMTMYSFYNVWVQHQSDNGNKQFSTTFTYNFFRSSWYSFLRLLDINYEEEFSCSQCGKEPKILLFDGTSLAFQKQFIQANVTIPPAENSSIKFAGSSHKERVFIDDKRTRALLLHYAKKEHKTDEEDFLMLQNQLAVHQKSLLPLMKYFKSIGCTTTCPEEYRHLLKVLASNSPVCATFNFKHLKLLRQLIMSRCITSDVVLARNLQEHIPIIFELLMEIKEVPLYLIDVIEDVIVKAEAPFKSNSNVTTDKIFENSLAFFPSLPQQCGRGQYVADKAKTEQICSKKATRHPTLLPGIFTVFCQHGICYGFEVMESSESPNRPFSFLRTRFSHPPEIIVYDNACNLHQYCLNRDPLFFANTLFVVDELHWDNHTACSMGYKSSGYPLLRKVNSQIVEQNNSKLKKLKGSLSYMKPENFMATLIFFLWYCNFGKKKKQIVTEGK